MLKRVYGKKLSRNTNSRKALFRGLTAALILNGKVETTKTKAKAVAADVDKLMKFVGKNDFNARRVVMAKLGNDKKVVDKLFADFNEIASKKKSGFSRIINLPNRKGDNAPMVRLEFVK
jgi:large subunit ribosomal protein L17